MGRLDTKVAIITGAAGGIGRTTAQLFASEGAKVIVADWDEAGVETSAQQIREAGGEATSLRVDVSNAEDVQGMAHAAAEKYGQIDVLFNNAGVEGDTQAFTADCTLENWDRVISINLTGVFLGMKYVIPYMLKSGGGSIINTSSISGLVGYPPGMPAYTASKGAVIQLSRTTAMEYAKKNIRVNAICPGVIRTGMSDRFIERGNDSLGSGGSDERRKALEALEPMGRLGEAEEIARMALFLASDESSYCTGAPFIVDGGFVAT